MSESAPDLTVDVVSDVVCPWCWIGKRRLEMALAQRDRTDVPVLWHAFQLNPNLPAEGVERAGYLERKFGGAERAREIYARVTDAGREVGLAFDFDRIERQPNTLDAHRLIAWAQQRDPKAINALLERLFAAYFTEGVDIGKPDELARLAGEAGYDRGEAAKLLAGDTGRREVTAAEEQARRLGITGVPLFIFNQRLAVSGAQPPEVLLDAMAQAERTPETA
jgi:predicted DsbA family dithiol-disulfide isomerase